MIKLTKKKKTFHQLESLLSLDLKIKKNKNEIKMEYMREKKRGGGGFKKEEEASL